MNRKLKLFSPVAALVVGIIASWVLIEARPEVERREVEIPLPLVRVVEVERSDQALDVVSQGTVEPHTESTIVTQVAGRIVAVTADFADGGFFEQRQVLVQIDRRDYELAVAQAEAQVAQARVRLQREEAEAELARQEWEELGEGDASPLALRQPQLAEAKAALQAAEASLQQAELNLERTAIRAPFDGRVRHKQADVGQFVAPGTPLATVFAIDYAEVRLPVPKRDLAYLDLELGFRQLGEGATGPIVVLRGELGGETLTWNGHIVRTDGQIDARTRMLDLFARVDDPFRRRSQTPGTPLPIGLFVEAEIQGRTVEDVVLLPRSALRGDQQVLVVDEESRLRFRRVQILRLQGEEVLVDSGLMDGELVCVSPLETVVDGMRVRTTRLDSAVEGPRGQDAVS